MPIPVLTPRDALVLVDVQNDFCPGGALAVPEGDKVIPVLNRWIDAATEGGAMVVVSRDWHPAGHISFREQGGPWPVHCVHDTPGAEFHPDLKLPSTSILVTKGTDVNRECYSALMPRETDTRLRSRGVQRLWIGGLSLDSCVRATVLDGLEEHFEVHVIVDGTRAAQTELREEVLLELAAAGAVIERDSRGVQ